MQIMVEKYTHKKKRIGRRTYFCLGLDICSTIVGRLQFLLELFGKGSKYVWINLQLKKQPRD